ncbi:MAG TPA: hypothetical protein DGT21_21810 [Armatimonadetes bacterium]|nr:hypothetical protein [Armatimonadota bacterium]
MLLAAPDGTAAFEVRTVPGEPYQQSGFCERALVALPVRLIVLDADLRIILANPAYCGPRGVAREDVEGRHIDELFPASLLDGAGLRDALRATIQSGESVQWSGYRYRTEDHDERTINVCLSRFLDDGDRPLLMVTLEDVTERHRQLYERSLLQQIAQAMLGMLQLPRLLHAILTGMTAGGAVGLGFNRAFLMLLGDDDVLRTEMAVGPSDPGEARQIWSEVSGNHTSIEDFLADYDALRETGESRFLTRCGELEIPLGEPDMLPASVLFDGRTAHVIEADRDPRVPEYFYTCLEANEFIVAPLIVKDRRIGIAYADNFISRHPISESDRQLFTSLANHAALAIDRAAVFEEAQTRAQELEEAYRQLEAAQEQTLRAESLATIGEMTAIVAHEIRNPLSTIGGFANLMLRQADDRLKVQRNARIIFDEVMRLEAIVNGLLTFTRPGQPRFRWCRPHDLLSETLEMIENKLDVGDVKIEVICPEELPQIFVDIGQVRQVLDNLCRNALDAMAGSGRLTIEGAAGDGGTVIISVSDTGAGISPEDLERIFDTFFTTKETGMGLGLALSQKIAQDHGAELKVESEEGVGTTFRLVFPTDYDELLSRGIVEIRRTPTSPDGE